jgi:hypothetical protein
VGLGVGDGDWPSPSPPPTRPPIRPVTLVDGRGLGALDEGAGEPLGLGLGDRDTTRRTGATDGVGRTLGVRPRSAGDVVRTGTRTEGIEPSRPGVLVSVAEPLVTT